MINIQMDGLCSMYIPKSSVEQISYDNLPNDFRNLFVNPFQKAEE